MSPLGPRQLFVYWRVRAGAMASALGALSDWHDQLRQQVPGLQAHCFRRHDAGAEAGTLMETYAIDAARSPEGIDEATERRLVDVGRSLTAPWRDGDRHVEIFDRVS